MATCAECGSELIRMEPTKHECNCDWCSYSEFNYAEYRCPDDTHGLGLSAVETKLGVLQIMLKEKLKEEQK